MTRLLLEDDIPNIAFTGPRAWILATVIAIAVILIFGLPLFEKVREIIGAAAQPRIDEHDGCPEGHPDIRTALALLNQSIEDLQRQINTIESNRKESFETIRQQLQMAIDLLPRE